MFSETGFVVENFFAVFDWTLIVLRRIVDVVIEFIIIVIDVFVEILMRLIFFDLNLN